MQNFQTHSFEMENPLVPWLEQRREEREHQPSSANTRANTHKNNKMNWNFRWKQTNSFSRSFLLFLLLCVNVEFSTELFLPPKPTTTPAPYVFTTAKPRRKHNHGKNHHESGNKAKGENGHGGQNQLQRGEFDPNLALNNEGELHSQHERELPREGKVMTGDELLWLLSLAKTFLVSPS